MIRLAGVVIVVVMMVAGQAGAAAPRHPASTAGAVKTAASPATAAAVTPAEWKPVEEALGHSGQWLPGDVFKLGMPRTDLHVTVDGIAVAPALALGSWAAFKQMGDETMVMGDLVLLDAEVAPVISGLLAGAFEVTGIHNHLNNVTPHVMYVHYAGHGKAVALAQALRRVLASSGTPFGATVNSAPAVTPALDQKQIEQIIGRPGKLVAGGVLQFGIARGEKITENGMEIPPALGTATALNFQPLEGGRAAITGDFVLLAGEVNPVAHILRDRGVEVTALHNHMLNEEPRLFFMHFWSTGDPLELARDLRAALDRTGEAPGLRPSR